EPEMRPLIADFVAQLPEQVEQLEQALRGGDREGLRRQLHQLKGSGGGYGFMPVTDAAARAERALLDHLPPAAVAGRVRELIQVITSIDGYRTGEDREAA